MITIDYVRTFARYNRWQNRSIYGAADALTEAQRKEPRGAFFGSIQATLNHLLWGDRVWMSRFVDWPRPAPANIAESAGYYTDWDELKRERAATDKAIVGWADALAPEWLSGELSYFSGAAGRQISKPRWLFVTHLFNHQTHHRGQVHCLLTQFGAKPSDTDLPFMPD